MSSAMQVQLSYLGVNEELVFLRLNVCEKSVGEKQINVKYMKNLLKDLKATYMLRHFITPYTSSLLCFSRNCW